MPRVRIRLARPKPSHAKGVPRLDFEALVVDLEAVLQPLLEQHYDGVELKVEASSNTQIEVSGFPKSKEEKPVEIVGTLLEQAYEALDMEKYQVYG
jgi:hypothetical protein